MISLIELSQQFTIKRGEGIFTQEFKISEQNYAIVFFFLPKFCWPSDVFPGESSHQHEKVLREFYISLMYVRLECFLIPMFSQGEEEHENVKGITKRLQNPETPRCLGR